VAAPLGNKNAVKNRPWADAINRAVLANDGQRLRSIAEKLLVLAEAGDVSALRELGDRLDGKPKQQIEASGPDGGAIHISVTSDESKVL
jgi:hypothetical protein